MQVGFVPKIYNDSPGVARRYVFIRDLVQQAEAEGFDSIWIYDHLLMRFPDQPTEGPWESWTILTALAEATRKVELGTIVLCTQFRNPALLAKMAATFDEVSTGRLILGLGAGWHEPEFKAFGYPFDHRRQRRPHAAPHRPARRPVEYRLARQAGAAGRAEDRDRPGLRCRGARSRDAGAHRGDQRFISRSRRSAADR